jgi:hypothetical protein
MCGFKEHDAADRFGRQHDELRNFLHSRSRHNRYVPPAGRQPSIPSSRSHRDWRHTNRMIRKFTPSAPLPNCARSDRTIEPELMNRMLLMGCRFGIQSERRLCEEVHLNLADRSFCRLKLDGAVPVRSTIFQEPARPFPG